jgi:hypothetical protein
MSHYHICMGTVTTKWGVDGDRLRLNGHILWKDNATLLLCRLLLYRRLLHQALLWCLLCHHPLHRCLWHRPLLQILLCHLL